ncbi:hypothetical protein [Streptomyces rubellomurinus]|uniref:Uncharacterized protein n=1 Tax=Streptomyces rubellomurinus (strain ATCC 31215) TaxID=359131 RepID=A0A0F2TH00_STRR3|nr:hypothetical protein [Streptomyces rubellomurinus]KJS61530.1 hypothetical protein VM95_14655 [Streptomyces rubellomurinus]
MRTHRAGAGGRPPMYRARPGGRRYHPVRARAAAATSGTAALLACGALALGLGALGDLHAGRAPYLAHLALCALLGGCARPRAAPLIGLAAWLCCNAFAEHRHAELGWAGPGWELGHYAMFTAAAWLAALPAVLPRRTVRVALLRPDGTA